MGARDTNRPPESSGTVQVLLCALMLGALALVLLTSDPVIHSRPQVDLAPVADCLADTARPGDDDQGCHHPDSTQNDAG